MRSGPIFSGFWKLSDLGPAVKSDNKGNSDLADFGLLLAQQVGSVE
jgi:hypothetical protein